MSPHRRWSHLRLRGEPERGIQPLDILRSYGQDMERTEEDIESCRHTSAVRREESMDLQELKARELIRMFHQRMSQTNNPNPIASMGR
jgi:hypothetical protein